MTFFFIALIFSLARAESGPATYEVCASCAYTSIQAAVDAAPANSVVHVQAGAYNETPIVIKRPLSLQGEPGAIIDGEGKNQIVVIQKADHVRVSGFTLQHGGSSYTAEIAGVRVIESSDCSISGNRLLDTTYGVYLENSHSCRIEDNVIAGHALSESSGGNAIHIWYGDHHLVRHNVLSGHRDGVYLEFTNGTRITDNRSTANIRYGLHFMQSNDTVYENNDFAGNGAGVAVMYSRRIRMVGNRFHENTGPAAYGLLLKEVMDSEISQNQFDRDTVGIFMEGSNRSRFRENLFRHNGWALKIMGDCEENRFEDNDFNANTFEVATNADHSWNSFDHNYWSQYDGYDLNRDGFGDIPHRPVSLSSILLERTDSSYFLMNSFFFTVLDQVERALPGLIPEPLKDEHPRMRPVKAWPAVQVVGFGGEL